MTVDANAATFDRFTAAKGRRDNAAFFLAEALSAGNQDAVEGLLPRYQQRQKELLDVMAELDAIDQAEEAALADQKKKPPAGATAESNENPNN